MIGLVACGDSAIIAPPPAPTPPASVSATIGAEGGTITGPGDVRVTIPAGALAAATRITIAQSSDGISIPTGWSTVGPLTSLTPHGLTFGVPVSLTLPPATTNPGTVLLKTNPGSDVWEQLETAESGGVVTTAITGLSVIGRFCCFPAPRLGGPNDITGVPEDGFWIFNVTAIGAAPFTYQWSRNAIRMPGETNRTVLINPVRVTDNGARYSVEVTDARGIVAVSRAATLGVVPLPPVIVADPADLQVVAGASATFSAAATSSVTPSLQWQRSNDGGQTWSDITGATATSYTLPNVHLTNDNDARFRMRASNSSPLGNQPVASRAARLTVTGVAIPPAITTEPQSQSVSAGTSASFTVVASGTSLDYQWERAPSRNGVFTPIANATSASYSISNASLTDHQAAFRVRVSNPAGAALSAIAELTVTRAATVALTRVAGGSIHSVALRGNGTLVAWGSNVVGQLGRGTTDTAAHGDPAQIVGPIGTQCSVATFAVGAHYNLAVCANGDVWSWGRDEYGELGQAGSQFTAPLAQRSNGGPARHVAAGRVASAHSLAVLSNNPLVAAWGLNWDGQLGDGMTAESRGPGLVANISHVIRVAAGDGFSLALRQDGTVWGWGSNGEGQLGNGTTTAALRPTPSPSLRGIIAIATGSSYGMAIDQNGTVHTWGFNRDGQLGDGTTTSRHTPRPVSLPRPAIGIAAGEAHALALLEDGSVYAWGDNSAFQVGVDRFTTTLTPRQVASPLPGGIIAIGAGRWHSLAVDSNYDVWAWGSNSHGQLGDGPRAFQMQAARVSNLNLR